jgi:putative alpha-1,2-mannosidase
MLIATAPLLALAVVGAAASSPLTSSSSSSSASASPLTSLVDPLIGSRGGLGFGGWGNAQRCPAAFAPFPLLRLGPDTTRVDPVMGEFWSPLARHSGYFGSDSWIRSFSTTRMQGAGDSDLGTFGLMLARGDVADISARVARRPVQVPGLRAWFGRSAFLSAFDPTTVVAAPAYYSAWLTDAATHAQMTVSGTHAGMLQFSCGTTSPTGGGGGGPGPDNVTTPCVLALDVCESNNDPNCIFASATLAPGSATGEANSFTLTAVVNNTGDFSGRGPGVRFFLHAIVTASVEGSSPSTPVYPTSAGLWQNWTLSQASLAGSNASSTSGSLGAALFFPSPTAVGAGQRILITVRIGLSFTDPAHALANLVAEQQPGANASANPVPAASGAAAAPWLSFDDMQARTLAQWEQLLGGVQVSLAPVMEDHVEDDEEEEEEEDGAPRPRRFGLGAETADRAALDRIGRTRMGLGDVDPGTAADADAAAKRALSAFLASPEGALLALERRWADVTPIARLLAKAGTSSATSSSSTSLPDPEELERAVAAALAATNVSAALADVRVAADTERRRRRRQLRSVGGGAGGGGDLTVFYSLLVNAYTAPTTYADSSDGSYLGFDGAMHTSAWPGGAWLSDLSLWDTHRSQVPWLALALPLPLRNTAASLLLMTEQGGHLPRWPFANVYTNDMVGSHGVQVLADCLYSGTCGFPGDATTPLSAILPAVLASVESQDDAGGPGGSCSSLGYCPFPAYSGSATLEYAYDAFVASELAALAGDVANATVFAGRAVSFYRAVWQPANLSMYPRFVNGSFADVPTLYQTSFLDPYYTEGDAAQWRFSVPHNLTDLITLFGEAGGAGPQDPAPYVDTLQVLLANQTYWPLFTFLPNPWCWLGNEPSMLLPFQHAWVAGEEWRAQFWARWHLREYFTPTVDGIPGNDDYGTLSSWALFTYLGLYPVAATRTFVLTGPVFANATVSVPAGWTVPDGGAPAGGFTTLQIVAHNASSANVFVACASANGVALTAGPFVTYGELWPATGGKAQAPGAGTALLEFSMVPEPVPWCA